jgi:hypothetical protein
MKILVLVKMVIKGPHQLCWPMNLQNLSYFEHAIWSLFGMISILEPHKTTYHSSIGVMKRKSNWIRAIYLTYLWAPPNHIMKNFQNLWFTEVNNIGEMVHHQRLTISCMLCHLSYSLYSTDHTFKLIVLWNALQLNLLSEVASKSTCHNCQQEVNH